MREVLETWQKRRCFIQQQQLKRGLHPSYLSRARDGRARVYQEQRRYREAERIFQDQLEAAVNSSYKDERNLDFVPCI